MKAKNTMIWLRFVVLLHKSIINTLQTEAIHNSAKDELCNQKIRKTKESEIHYVIKLQKLLEKKSSVEKNKKLR